MIRLLRRLPLLATLAATIWALSTNPFAAPFTERSAADLALTLERMVRRQATPHWLRGELAASVAAGEVDRAAMLVALAADLGHEVDIAEAEALIAARSGPLEVAADCGACMADIAACRTLALLGACAVPFEMSPFGDANALRRAGAAYLAGDPVDRVDAGLALVGLGATGAIVISGGSSASVKAGAGLLRLGRRMGSLTPGLARTLVVPVRWSAVPRYLRGAAPLDEVTDIARLRAATDVAADLGRVRAATSTAEALRLARLAEGPEDAARLARVAEAAGPQTVRSFEVLGKGRVFRAMIRLSNAAAGALALLWLSVVQVAVVAATRAGGAVWRKLLPAPAPPRGVAARRGRGEPRAAR